MATLVKRTEGSLNGVCYVWKFSVFHPKTKPGILCPVHYITKKKTTYI